MSDRTFEASLKRSFEIEKEIDKNPQKFRLLTGERPTGKLHLGHLFGSIQGRVAIQKKNVETLILIADYQVITDRDDLGNLQENALGILLDNLAAGLDPEKTTFFAHSAIPELNQLMLPFLSLVSESELHRNPTVKAELEAAQASNSSRAMTGLMLTYPVHQAADILFCKGNLVPVGKDQLPHIEQTRVIARRFNERFCGVDYSQLVDSNPKNIEKAVFLEPEALLSETPAVPGLDGRKMSKSFGNAIYLGMSNDETVDIIKKSPTDSEREISFDPENRPGVSSLLTTFALCRIALDGSASRPHSSSLANLKTGGEAERKLAEEINSDPKYGAGLLKQKTAEAVNEFLAPHRARRSELEKNEDFLREILRNGNQRAREIASLTLQEVREAMGMIY